MKTPNAPDLKLYNEISFEDHHGGPKIRVEVTAADTQVDATWILPANTYLAYSTLADSRYCVCLLVNQLSRKAKVSDDIIKKSIRSCVMSILRVVFPFLCSLGYINKCFQ